MALQPKSFTVMPTMIKLYLRVFMQTAY